jgi:hypothetical protein
MLTNRRLLQDLNRRLEDLLDEPQDSTAATVPLDLMKGLKKLLAKNHHPNSQEPLLVDRVTRERGNSGATQMLGII